jgi:hypothetical protein
VLELLVALVVVVVVLLLLAFQWSVLLSLVLLLMAPVWLVLLSKVHLPKPSAITIIETQTQIQPQPSRARLHVAVHVATSTHVQLQHSWLPPGVGAAVEAPAAHPPALHYTCMHGGWVIPTLFALMHVQVSAHTLVLAACCCISSSARVRLACSVSLAAVKLFVRTTQSISHLAHTMATLRICCHSICSVHTRDEPNTEEHDSIHARLIQQIRALHKTNDHSLALFVHVQLACA